MRSKRAAYHDAGHVILTITSRFHVIHLPLSGQQACAGPLIAVSQARLAASRSADPKGMLLRAEVAVETAVLFLAGRAAERHNCASVDSAEGMAEPESCATAHDHALARLTLAWARVATPLESIEAEAARRVNPLWELITRYAEDGSRVSTTGSSGQRPCR